MIDGENPLVGMTLGTESMRSKTFVEHALGGISNKMFVSKYKLYLPTKSTLSLFLFTKEPN